VFFLEELPCVKPFFKSQREHWSSRLDQSYNEQSIKSCSGRPEK
jgi:hypothetical protein